MDLPRFDDLICEYEEIGWFWLERPGPIQLLRYPIGTTITVWLGPIVDGAQRYVRLKVGKHIPGEPYEL
jgi:hypothetical protein